MSDREEIRKRVEEYRKFQERLCAEREARMNESSREIRKSLADGRAGNVDRNGKSG